MRATCSRGKRKAALEAEKRRQEAEKRRQEDEGLGFKV
jgi:hypothetical protein